MQLARILHENNFEIIRGSYYKGVSLCFNPFKGNAICTLAQLKLIFLRKPVV